MGESVVIGEDVLGGLILFGCGSFLVPRFDIHSQLPSFYLLMQHIL